MPRSARVGLTVCETRLLIPSETLSEWRFPSTIFPCAQTEAFVSAHALFSHLHIDSDLLLRGIKAWVCIEKLKVIYFLKHFIKKFHISYVTVMYGHL